MHIKQFEAFLMIAGQGSFAEAATRLNVTQSTISVRIKELEQELGVILFDRSRRQVQLTPKGRELLDYAERAISLQREIRLHVGSPEAVSGVVRVGVAELIAVTWLPHFAAMARQRYPELILEFEVAMNPSMLNGVRSGDLDIALVVSTDTMADFRACDLGKVPFAWMAGASFEMPDRVVSYDEVKRWPIIFQGTDSFMRQLASGLLNLSGKSQRNGTSCNSLAALASLTTAGIGISLMPIMTSERDLAEGRLKIVPLEQPHIDIGYSAVCSNMGTTIAINALMDLAVEASTFSRP